MCARVIARALARVLARAIACAVARIRFIILLRCVRLSVYLNSKHVYVDTIIVYVLHCDYLYVYLIFVL